MTISTLPLAAQRPGSPPCSPPCHSRPVQCTEPRPVALPPPHLSGSPSLRLPTVLLATTLSGLHSSRRLCFLPSSTQQFPLKHPSDHASARRFSIFPWLSGWSCPCPASPALPHPSRWQSQPQLLGLRLPVERHGGLWARGGDMEVCQPGRNPTGEDGVSCLLPHLPC